MNVTEYTHEIGREVRSISGGYEIEKEAFLDIDGQKVLYAVGNGVVDSSCCGVGGCRYALVPGVIRALKIRRNDQGQWISEVEPVAGDALRRKISDMIKEKEVVQQIQFL